MKDKLLENIKSGSGYVDHRLSFDDLMQKDENGITYLEYSLKKKGYLGPQIAIEIKDNMEAVDICLRYEYIDFLRNCDEDFFFSNSINGKRIIDEAFRVKRVFSVANIILPKIKNHFEVLYIVKDNVSLGYYQLSDEFFDNLFNTSDGNKVLDSFMDNDFFLRFARSKASLEAIFNYSARTGNYKVLCMCEENKLLSNLPNGKMLIEFLFINGLEPSFDGFTFNDKRVFDILVKYGRLDLASNGSTSFLVSMFDEDKTYLEYLLEEEKKGASIKFEELAIRGVGKSLEDFAKMLIILGKNDAICYMPSISVGEYLEANEYRPISLLDTLLSLDKDVTVNNILPKFILRDPNINVILKMYGVDNLVAVQISDKSYKEEYYDKYNESYAKEKKSVYEKDLEELRNLFLKDGVSDRKLIDLLIKSYVSITSKENEVVLMEIKQLIAIKKAHFDTFTYQKTYDTSTFNKGVGAVFIGEESIPAIRHETSHALHYFLADYETDSRYFDIKERLRNNPLLIEKTRQIADATDEIFEQNEEMVSEEDIREYYANNKDVANNIKIAKERVRSNLEGLYSSDELDRIIDEVFSLDKILKGRVSLDKKQIAAAKFDLEYEVLSTVSDFIDAIFDGKVFNEALLDKDGNRIKGLGGHGIEWYYILPEKGFQELIANYGSILKSDNAEFNIDFLRTILGNELIDMLDDYYKNTILKSNKYINQNNLEDKKNKTIR